MESRNASERLHSFLMIIPILLLIISLLILIKSANILVDGASSFAKRLGVSSLVIGLTIVAFGTSAPELSVNISSTLNGVTDIAVGNIIGSNIANILLILGIVVWMKGITLQHSTIWKEIPFMLLSAFVVMIMGSDRMIDNASSGMLTAIDGLVLLSFFLIFLYYSYGISKNGKEEGEIKIFGWIQTFAMMILGLAGLIVSGNLLVGAATDIAVTLGVTQRVIGLTIVAIGTSLPELMTSVVAARKGHPDLAIGNIVGSNILNVFFILGVTSLIAPLPISQTVLSDMLIAVACSLLVFIFLFIGQRNVLDRWQGAMMVVAYVAYVGILIVSG